MTDSISLLTPAGMNACMKNTLAETLGIEITDCREGYIEAIMPVDSRTHQPLGLLHGGATVALAETVASIGGMALVAAEGKIVVGLEINANHLRSATTGTVKAVGTVLHRGKTTQVWEIRVFDDAGRPTAISRCTLAVIKAQ